MITDIAVRQRLLAALGLALATLCWGGNSVAARLSIGEIPPLTLSFWRWALVFCLLIPFTARQVSKERDIIFKHKGKLVVLAITSVSAFNTLLYLAAQSIQAVNVALIQVGLPFICIVLSIPLLGVYPKKAQSAGLLVAAVGLLAIFSKGDVNVLLALDFGRGDMIMLLAVVIWALYTVLLRRFAIPLSGHVLLTVCVGIGILFIAPFYLWEFLTQGGFEMKASTVCLLAYVTVFASIVAFLSWNYGVSILGANQASMFNFLIPVFSALIAIPVLGEGLQTYHFLGAGFIFAGLWLSGKR
ncbi:DMT family transporter [Endozoicomonas lisbonensis]|uniref:Drug/metabolite transporter (DMT)-like permease n=1 Tax=Endozoicomonas lisbonensis TaxID=3120522 RepID=A0ABV2SQ87_9GAMM